MYCIDLAEELRHADAALADMEALGRLAGLATMTPDEAADAAELAFERSCIEAADRPQGRGAVPGLVSVPTSGPRRSAAVARDQSQALRDALRATVVDKARARIAGLRRSVGFAARAVGAAADRPGYRAGYVAMLTCTYSPAHEWSPRHISDCLHRIRKWLHRRRLGMRYVWVAELQKRGALHYHVALWLPHGATIPKADQQGWWPHGDTNIKAARKAVPYLLKYLSKGMDCTGFPKGARIHGSGGQEHALKRAKRWLGYPAFIKARADVHDDWRRAPGGGWADPVGEVWPSEYARAWVGDRWSCVPVHSYSRPLEASGPFSWIKGD